MTCYFYGKNWPEPASELFLSYINTYLNNQGKCSVMLTGGRSAEDLFLVMRHKKDFKSLCDVNFYLTDERYVPTDSIYSNFGMIMRTLFSNGIPNNCKLYSIKTNFSSIEQSVKDYEKLLPNSIDCLLLSMGDDGHIASLFSGDAAYNEFSKKVTATQNMQIIPQRVTISSLVINNAKSVIVLAVSGKKSNLYYELKINSLNNNQVPANLVLNRDWIINNH